MMTRIIYSIFYLFLCVLAFGCAQPHEIPENRTRTVRSAAGIKGDEAYLISECKKVAQEWGSESAQNLDKMNVDIYTEGNVVIVNFSIVPRKGFRVVGGCTTFYFFKDSGKYEFVRVAFGQ